MRLKVALIYFSLGMLFIKTLLLRELASFDMLTLLIILDLLYDLKF